jgi:hypothetical protein
VTAATISFRHRFAGRPWVAVRAAGRLLRLELRHNTMIWMLPLLAAAFWLDAYRWASADPPAWDLRAAELPITCSGTSRPSRPGRRPGRGGDPRQPTPDH